MSKFQYRLSQNQILSPSTRLLILEPTNPQRVMHFSAGQYAALAYHLDNQSISDARCFSIANAENRTGAISFGIRVAGEYTQGLSRLKPGTSFTIYGPFGSFTPQLNHPNQPLVLFAGGIGITPMISIIQSANSRIPITLFYSNKSARDLPFFNVLNQLAKSNPNFKVIYLLSEEQRSGFVYGRMNSNLFATYASRDFRNAAYYICGPTGFTDSSISMLHKMHIPSENIITESFTQFSNDKHNQSLVRLTYLSTALSLSLLGFLAVKANPKNRVAASPLPTATNSLSSSNSPVSNSSNSSPTSNPSASAPTNNYYQTPIPSTPMPVQNLPAQSMMS
jgi:ferredoxin-NADP reductase